jgi:sugar phosphate isomerase/epimerase
MWIGETDPRYVGVSLDLGHWTAEGMKSGWKASIDLMQGRVGLVAIKSYGWFHEPDPKTGEKRWVGKLVPLKEGSVQFKQAFEYLRQGGWDADGKSLVSVHSEYQGGGSWRSLEVPELIDQTREDFDYLREQVGVLQPA